MKISEQHPATRMGGMKTQTKGAETICFLEGEKGHK